MCAVAAAKSLQSCPTLCDPKDGSPPGSPVPGILQARTLEWVAILLQCMKVRSESEVTQSCLTLRDRMYCSPPGSSIHGIFQARVLEWGAIVSRQTTCWNPIPNMRVLRCRGLGRWLGPESGAPWMGWVPLEEGPEGLHLCRVGAQEDQHHTLALLSTLINFSASRTVRNKRWSHRLWYSVITALDKRFPSPLSYLPRWWAFELLPMAQ